MKIYSGNRNGSLLLVLASGVSILAIFLSVGIQFSDLLAHKNVNSSMHKMGAGFLDSEFIAWHAQSRKDSGLELCEEGQRNGDSKCLVEIPSEPASENAGFDLKVNALKHAQRMFFWSGPIVDGEQNCGVVTSQEYGSRVCLDQ